MWWRNCLIQNHINAPTDVKSLVFKLVVLLIIVYPTQHSFNAADTQQLVSFVYLFLFQSLVPVFHVVVRWVLLLKNELFLKHLSWNWVEDVVRVRVRSHVGWSGERNIMYKGVKTLPSRCILKLRGEARKGKSKEDNIC